MGAQQPFYPTRIPFVKNVPQKGAVILLPDGFGQAFEGWMKDLYPSAEPKKVLNAFQDVQFWSWEITPDQVQETALRPRTPTTGLTLTAWKGPEKLGEWRIPCLFSGIDYWFRAFAGQKGLPNQGPVRFKIEGALSDPGRLPLRLRGIGPIHGKIGDQWVRVKKGTLGDIKVGAPRKPHARIELTYDCVPSDFNLVIEKKMPEGWRPMPSEDLEPAAPVAGL
jgi:hypothetical protein